MGACRKLALQWSPEQISGWLKQQFPTDETWRNISRTIYRKSLGSPTLRGAEEGI